MKKLSLIMLLVFAIAGCKTNPTVGETNRSVRIVRDNYGTPHIYADTVYGIFYGYGYSIAQDRLFQMEMAKRSTQGKVSEVFGEEFLDFDISIRKNFRPESIRQQLAKLSEQDGQIFEGYAAGLNAWLSEIEKNPDELLPKQFLDFDFLPKKWSSYDVAMIFVGTMANRYADFNTELENSKILAKLADQHGNTVARQIFDDMNPRTNQHAPTTIPIEDWQGDVGLGSITQRIQKYDVSDSVSGSPIHSGFSNCWVLGKKKARDANAILVNGPQFGWFNPAYVYSVGLHGAGFDLVGNTPFGYPIVMFGHNNNIAWGSTWGAGDMVDIYRETLSGDNQTQYLHNGEVLDFEDRREEIVVRHGETKIVNVSRSVHGPIVAKAKDGKFAFAKKRSWDGKEIQTLLAWVHSTRTDNFDDWLTHARKAAFNINWYFADKSGNIGYSFVGHYPERHQNHDNRFPVSGEGELEWQGRKAFEQANPHVLNPNQGYIANWNNKPAAGVLNPDEFWYSWSRGDRVDYLSQQIEQQERFSPDEAWHLISKSSYAELNAPYFLDGIQAAAANSNNQRLRSAQELLARWNLQSRDRNNDGYYDEPATALFRTFLGHLIEQVLADDLGETYAFFSATGYPTPQHPTGAGTNIQTGVKTIIEAMAGRTAYDFFNGQPVDQVIGYALERSLDSLTNQQGGNMETWRLPAPKRPFDTSNFLGVPQNNEEQLMLAPIEQNRGTENNMIVFRNNDVVGYEVTPPGQNAFIAPDGKKGPHFDDQFQMYHRFEKKRMWFYPQDVEAHKTSDVVLIF